MGKVITTMTDWFNQEKTSDFLDKLRNKLKGWRIDTGTEHASIVVAM